MWDKPGQKSEMGCVCVLSEEVALPSPEPHGWEVSGAAINYPTRLRACHRLVRIGENRREWHTMIFIVRNQVSCRLLSRALSSLPLGWERKEGEGVGVPELTGVGR